MNDKLADAPHIWKPPFRWDDFDGVCRDADNWAVPVRELTELLIAALRRSQPEPVPEGFVRTVPDPQMRTMCTAQAMGQQLAKLQEEGEMPTERMVEVAAQWLSESPLIQEPKLPPPAWTGLARHVLQAALSAAEAEGRKS